jgi:hypothetical protein
MEGKTMWIDDVIEMCPVCEDDNISFAPILLELCDGCGLCTFCCEYFGCGAEFYEDENQDDFWLLDNGHE